ncbi:MAG: 50S ribosomal protein L2, partial [Pseudomonadota bacterium]
MMLVKVKPTSPGRRSVVKVVHPDLHKGQPHSALVEPMKRGSGRNNAGRITMRHQGGGHKHHYRIIDFRRDKDGISGRVEHLEHDPNRSAHIALVLYADGERRYMISPKDLHAGDTVISIDEGPGRVKLEKIASLKPAFKKDGTITAASSSSINDGAAALVMMRASTAASLGCKPLARIVSHAVH